MHFPLTALNIIILTFCRNNFVECVFCLYLVKGINKCCSYFYLFQFWCRQWIKRQLQVALVLQLFENLSESKQVQKLRMVSSVTWKNQKLATQRPWTLKNPHPGKEDQESTWIQGNGQRRITGTKLIDHFLVKTFTQKHF